MRRYGNLIVYSVFGYFQPKTEVLFLKKYFFLSCCQEKQKLFLKKTFLALTKQNIIVK